MDFNYHKRKLDESMFLRAASSGDKETACKLRSSVSSAKTYKALQYAAHNGHAAVIEELLYTFKNWRFTKAVGELDNDGGGWWNLYDDKMTSSPLHLAVREGHLTVVQKIIDSLRRRNMLLQRSPSVSLSNWFQEHLYWAVRWGHAPIVNLLVSQLLLSSPLLVPVHPLLVPLHLAAHYNHIEVAKVLVMLEKSMSALRQQLPKELADCKIKLKQAECQRDQLKQDESKADELIRLDEDYRRLQDQKRLLEMRQTSPLHVPLYSKDGFTALHLAAQSGSCSIMEDLLHCSTLECDVNGRSHPDLFTPLHMAANFGRTDAVHFLLEGFDHGGVSKWGVELMARDCMGRTALHYAAREGHAAITLLLLDYWSQTQAEKNIADTPDDDGLLPLHMAAMNGHVDVIEILCQHGGVHKTAGKRSLGMRDCLERKYMEQGAMIGSYPTNMNFPRPKLLHCFLWKTQGFTPLHFAARYAHKVAVRELLKARSMLNLTLEGNTDSLFIRDNEGLLAYDWMRMKRQGQTFLRYVRELEKNDGLQLVERLKQASNQNKICRRRVAQDVSEEKEAMRELEHSWTSNIAPPIRVLVLKCLYDQEFGRLSEWVQWAVKTNNLVLLKRLLPLTAETPDNEKDDYAYLSLLNQALNSGHNNIARELLMHPKIKEDALMALDRALECNFFDVAKKILLQPEIVFDDSVTVKVKERLQDGKSLVYEKEREQKSFLIVFVTREGLVGASNFLKWLLPWAKKKGLSRLVEVLLDVPELKRGLYEDRQVYLECANSILVGAALIVGLAFQGWLQPPMGYAFEYDGLNYAEVHKRAVRSFWWFNNGAFFFAVGTLVAGAKGSVPLAEQTDILKSVQKVGRAVAVASVLLTLALVCVVGAFATAGLAVLPPLPGDLIIMKICVGLGATMCTICLLWFSISIWPLFCQTLSYFFSQILREEVKTVRTVFSSLSFYVNYWASIVFCIPIVCFLSFVFKPLCHFFHSYVYSPVCNAFKSLGRM